jgi:HK97 family phage portal protein
MGFLTDWLNRTVSDAEMKTVTGKLAEVLYLKELALYIAKSYIANAMSKCEFLVYENGQEVKNELYYALNVSPNNNQNSSQFLNKLINTLYDKNEVLVVQRGNRLYIADSFTINEQPFHDNVFENIAVENHPFSKSVKASDAFYFKLDDDSVKKFVDGMASTYNQLLACSFASYKRGRGQKYKLELENIQAGDKKFAEQFNTVIKDQLKEFVESDTAVYPQFRGQNLVEFPKSVETSSDLISLRKEMFDIVAQAFKIPQTMMYGNITNMQEIVKVYLTFCIDPLADMISEELTRKTNTFKTWNGGKNFIKVDTSRINHVDVFEVADKADKLIASGAASIDEVRRKLDWQELGTDFSQKHWITKNYSDVSESLTGEVK